MTKGRQAFHNTVIGTELRALRRAIERMPAGEVFNRNTQQGLYWDAHTRMFLRPKGRAAKVAA